MGSAGLSAAIRLQAQGHDVTIVEKLDKAGGRAYVFEQDGFTFDAGPTIITAPWLLHELFEQCGTRTEDYVDLRLLDPFYNIRFEDGSCFHYNGDPEHLRREVSRFNAVRRAPAMRSSCSARPTSSRPGMALIDKPFPSYTSMLKVLPDLVRLRADVSVADYTARFVKDERLRQVFSFHPLLVGGNPFQSSSIYALIHTLEREWGVWFAMGGTGALVQGLVRLFTDIGGTIRYDSEVSEINVDRATRRATGITLVDGEVLTADAVVSNGDVAQTYRGLVPAWARPRMTDKRIENYDYSMSLFVIYFGTNRTYENVAHHEILMGPRYKALLEDIFERKLLADDFSLYLHRPTATDPSLAPPGHDCWYVLSPVPHLGGEWTGRAWATAIATASWSTSRSATSPTSGSTSSRSAALTRATSATRSTATSAVPSPCSPRCSSRPTGARTTTTATSATSTSRARARTPGAGLPGVISSGKIVADLIGDAEGAPSRRCRSRWAPAPDGADAGAGRARPLGTLRRPDYLSGFFPSRVHISSHDHYHHADREHAGSSAACRSRCPLRRSRPLKTRPPASTPPRCACPASARARRPPPIVRKKFAEAIRQEAIEALVNDAFKQVIADDTLKIAAQPHVHDLKFEAGADLHLRAALRGAPRGGPRPRGGLHRHAHRAAGHRRGAERAARPPARPARHLDAGLREGDAG